MPTRSSRCWNGPRRRAATCPSARRSRVRWSSCGSRCRTVRACSPRSRCSRAGSAVNIADLEIAHSMEGEAGVIVMVVPEAGRRGVRSRAGRGRLPRRAKRAAMTLAPELVVHGGRPLRGRLRLPGCKGISHRGAALRRARRRAQPDRATWPTARTSRAPRPRSSSSGSGCGRNADGSVDVTGAVWRAPGAGSGHRLRATPARRCACSAGWRRAPVPLDPRGDDSLSRRPMRRVVGPAARDGRDAGRSRRRSSSRR